MNFTKALTMILTGVMAVSPMQYTNGQIVQPTGEVAEETAPVSRSIVPETGTVISSDSAIGGFSLIIDQYYDNVGEEESGDIYVDGVKMKAVHRVPSPYENLAIANVKTYVNIRSGPSTEYEAIGKLYRFLHWQWPDFHTETAHGVLLSFLHRPHKYLRILPHRCFRNSYL